MFRSPVSDQSPSLVNVVPVRKPTFLIIAGFFLIFLLIDSTCLAQQANRGNSHSVSLGLIAPVGNFHRSHLLGANLHYTWSPRRFGWPSMARHAVGVALETGADYYLGRKVETAGYDFRFGNYIDLHALAGIIGNPWSNVQISLLAGPALSFYEKQEDLGVALNLQGSYYLNKKLSIGPHMLFRKHQDEDALWALGIRVSLAF